MGTIVKMKKYRIAYHRINPLGLGTVVGDVVPKINTHGCGFIWLGLSQATARMSKNWLMYIGRFIGRGSYFIDCRYNHVPNLPII